MMTLHTRNALQIHHDQIPRLAVILYRMGFKDPLFQQWRLGQRFGLSTPLTDMLEWHIRGFADGTLDSEVEISRMSFQHLLSMPGSYYSLLIAILRRHGIPFRYGNRIPPDASYVYLREPIGGTIPVRVPSFILPGF
jgi:hypothetical protein